MTEYEAHQAFEDLCGDSSRAARLFSIYKNSHPHRHWQDPRKSISKEEVFAKKAKNEGFSDKEINALLNLQ